MVSLDFQNSVLPRPEPPPPQSKPAAFRPLAREDPAPPALHPQRGFPDKAPVNGTEPAPKAVAPAYNRFTPKPYTSAARPFERKFESPKFSHSLLPSEGLPKPDLPAKGPELDSGVPAFSVHADKPRYQANSIGAVPRAVPVR